MLVGMRLPGSDCCLQMLNHLSSVLPTRPSLTLDVYQPTLCCFVQGECDPPGEGCCRPDGTISPAGTVCRWESLGPGSLGGSMHSSGALTWLEAWEATATVHTQRWALVVASRPTQFFDA
jgi:hypothetical protein